MNDVRRLWTAEELLAELPAWKDDPGHRAMWEELATYLEECMRLRVKLEEIGESSGENEWEQGRDWVVHQLYAALKSRDAEP